VADERCDFAIADAEVDLNAMSGRPTNSMTLATYSRVHHVREICDTVLEVVMLNLHNTSRVLDNCNFWRQKHLRRTIQ
jgi:hypothetical protein